jgi:hypothetical protein
MTKKYEIACKILSFVFAVFIIVPVCLSIITNDFDITNGVFIDSNSAIKIFEKKLMKDDYSQSEIDAHKPYRVKFVICVWVVSNSTAPKVRGGVYTMFVLPVGGSAIIYSLQK